MRALTIEECNHIYGGGVGFGEALETVIDGIVEATHASEGAVSLAEALGAFEEKAPIASKYTTDQDVLHMDVYIANNYMHELQTHSGSDKITDSDQEKAIDALQNDAAFISIHWKINLKLWVELLNTALSVRRILRIQKRIDSMSI